MTIPNQSTIAVLRYHRAASAWQDKMAALGYAAAYRQAVATLLPWHLPYQSVMDVGCGAGDFAAAFAAERGMIHSLTIADPARAMLDVANARLATSARHLAIQAQPIEGVVAVQRQDIILCAHVVELCADPVSALCHLGSLLSPRGSILLVVSKPHWCNWLIWLRWRHRSLSRAEVLTLIAASGLCCTADTGFSRGPPSRTSHAYRITLPNGDQTC